MEETGSNLNSSELITRVFHNDPKRRLWVVPLIDPHFEGDSLDIRLGSKFLTVFQPRYPSVDPLNIELTEVRKLLQRVELRIGESLILHPMRLLLAATLEYFSFPQDLGASVVTRSSYGRLGLISATAIQVHPGYKGCLTLELVNLGDTPIVFYPGLRIAQLVVNKQAIDSRPEVTKSKYQLSTRPEFPRMWEDKDRNIVRRLRERFEQHYRESKAEETPYF